MTYKKILVCGGRDFDNRDLLFDTLNKLDPESVVCGGATGADDIAADWADWKRRIYHVYPANWRKWGGPAGPIRNKFMLLRENPDLVLAFPGGRGTSNMISTAEKYGHKVQIVEEKTDE